MSIPQPGSPWPPADYKAALDQVQRDASIVDVNTGALRALGGDAPQPVMSRFQLNGGIVGTMARAALGRPNAYRAGTAHMNRGVPLPMALSLVSADLLMATPPSFSLAPQDAPIEQEDGTTTGGNTQAAEFLQAHTAGDTFAAELHQAARQASSLGWEYGRIVWDETVSPHPWIEWVDADMAIAEYRWGRLHSVTFWDEFEHENHLWRLFQEHAPGRVNYALFRGTNDSVGRAMSFADLPQAEYLLDIVDADGGIDTGIEQLTAVHIPNRDRNPQWRKRSQLRYYGLSDTQLAGTLWEDFDKAWSDLIHEVDSSRARIMVTEDLLRTNVPGSGQEFEWHRDVFTLRRGGLDEPSKIEPVQFDMRIERYQMLLDTIMGQILNSLGISEITVGVSPQGQMTATEIRSRSSRTMATWGSKARMWRNGLSSITTALVNMDAVLNNYPQLTAPVEVAMVEPVQDTDVDRAQRAQSLRAARAASTYYLVRDLHPEWTEDEVLEEVARIQEEDAAGAPTDPFASAGFDMDPAITQPVGEEDTGGDEQEGMNADD